MVTREFIDAPLEAISPQPERFSFSFPTPADLERLRECICSQGQLFAFAAVRSGERFTLVDGARRLELLRELGATRIRLILMEPEHLWDDLLALRLSSGPALNAVETGRYLARRMADTGETARELAPEVFPHLGLPPREGAARDPLWLAGLPVEDALSFAGGDFSTSGVRILAGAPRADALAALKALRGFRLGVNKFTEAARLILECAWRDGITVEAWLDGIDLPSPADGGDRLREALKALRYPKLTELTSAFAADAAALPLSKRAALSHAPGFEGGRLRLTLSFATLSELADDAAKVAEKATAGELDILERYLD